MNRFFIHADRRLWEDHLLPGFFTHLELSPDFIDCVMAAIEHYINFRFSPDNSDIIDNPEVRHSLVCSILNDEGLIDVDTHVFTDLMELLYCSIHLDLQETMRKYNVYFVETEYAGTTLIGFTGEIFNRTQMTPISPT